MNQKKSCQMIGYFLLKDNRCVQDSKEGYEKGIILDSEYYLDLESLLSYPVTLSTAQAFSEKMKFALPTYEMLELVEKNLEKINLQLLSCGRGDCLVTGDIRKDYWTQGANMGGRRRMLLVVPMSAYNKTLL